MRLFKKRYGTCNVIISGISLCCVRQAENLWGTQSTMHLYNMRCHSWRQDRADVTFWTLIYLGKSVVTERNSTPHGYLGPLMHLGSDEVHIEVETLTVKSIPSLSICVSVDDVVALMVICLNRMLTYTHPYFVKYPRAIFMMLTFDRSGRIHYRFINSSNISCNGKVKNRTSLLPTLCSNPDADHRQVNTPFLLHLSLYQGSQYVVLKASGMMVTWSKIAHGSRKDLLSGLSRYPHEARSRMSAWTKLYLLNIPR